MCNTSITSFNIIEFIEYVVVIIFYLNFIIVCQLIINDESKKAEIFRN